MSVIQDVKARIDIVDIVSETVKLRKSGNVYSGFCPFHDNTRTPAFRVWPDTGTWRCFGQCGIGGDVFEFVMKRDNMEFVEALEVLAKRAGVELRPQTPQQAEQQQTLDRLRDLLQQAITWYTHLLHNAPQADVARRQLLDRGISPQALDEFEIGYALDDWHAAQQYFTGKGWSEHDLVDAGLLVQRDDGRTYDRFRNRIIIPIRDDRGRPAGFGARVVNPDDTPKYVNSPQSPLFNKSEILYGLNLAKKPIRQAQTAVVVEGYMDVIATHQAGCRNVVAGMGTALTEAQLKMLKRAAPRLVLALDADAAGQQAMLRGLETARTTLDRDLETTFNARGLIVSEGTLSLDIRVAVLPAGLDPDDVIHQDEDAWPRLIDGAQHVAEFVMQAVSAGRDLSDPKVVGDIAREVMPIINDVRDPAERAIHRQKLAALLSLDDRVLLEYAGTRPASAPRAPTNAPRQRFRQPGTSPAQTAGQPATATRGQSSALALSTLGTISRYPAVLSRLDRRMREAGLAPLDAEDFTDGELRQLFAIVRGSLAQAAAEPEDYIRDQAGDLLAPLLASAQSYVTDFNQHDDRAVGAVFQGALRLREQAIKHWMQQVKRMQHDAQTSGDHTQMKLLQDEIIANVATMRSVQQALDRERRGTR